MFVRVQKCTIQNINLLYPMKVVTRQAMLNWEKSVWYVPSTRITTSFDKVMQVLTCSDVQIPKTILLIFPFSDISTIFHFHCDSSVVFSFKIYKPNLMRATAEMKENEKTKGKKNLCIHKWYTSFTQKKSGKRKKEGNRKRFFLLSFPRWFFPPFWFYRI